MPRIKLELPEHFPFSTNIPVRITDINYGGHAGNDSILSIIHEARMQYLHRHGYDEKNFDGIGLIMSNVIIEFKKEFRKNIRKQDEPSLFFQTGRIGDPHEYNRCTIILVSLKESKTMIIQFI